MKYPLEKLRNIGVIAHIDAGKTTVTERMLYCANFMHSVGSVDDGTTVTDFDQEEQERGITIFSAAVTFTWNDHQINLIDTPGHVDFTAEVERSLRILDGAVVVFSAREGVEAQSETVWRQADKYHVPRIAFINKMDREGADFNATVSEIKKRLEANPVVLTIPVGSGPAHMRNPFRAIIDLISMKMFVFDQETFGTKYETCEIPDEYIDEAQLWRTQMMDQLTMFSDELTELILAEEDVPEDLIYRVVRDATLHNMAIPILCGTALHYIGVPPVLDAITRYLPSPLDIPVIEGIDPKDSSKEKKLYRKADINEPFSGLVFKVVPSRHGDLCYVRVYSGKLKAGSRVLNVGKKEKENVPQILRIMADSKEQIPEVTAGDIIGVIGLRNSVTGDTLSDASAPILLESIEFPETVISMAIEPETQSERKTLEHVLEMMRRQDPTFRADFNPETGQTLISGMGELHLEVIKHRLLRDFKLNVRVHHPRVSYRETIQHVSEVTGICDRKIGDTQFYAEIKIRMEPYPQSEKGVHVGTDLQETCDFTMLDAILRTLRECADGGGILGFPLICSKITVLAVHLGDGITEPMLCVAASDAYNKALHASGITLMEPIMKIEVTSPEECVGDIVSDLQQRRAVIHRTFIRGRNTIIEAHAPLINLFGYSNKVRGLSQGRATYSMEPATYGPAPKEVMENYM